MRLVKITSQSLGAKLTRDYIWRPSHFTAGLWFAITLCAAFVYEVTNASNGHL